jgi:hypothetical protein
VVILRG